MVLSCFRTSWKEPLLRPRLIPILLLDQGRLVKTSQFRKPQYVGDPINAIRIFNEKEVDEIMVIDISASREGRKPNFSLIQDLASECFMPLTYGGGIRSMSDANSLFSLGVEKICLQSAMFVDSHLVTELVQRFGSQAIIFALDVNMTKFGKVQIFERNRKLLRKLTWAGALDLALECGVGEILVCDVGREGTMRGVDVRLIAEVTSTIPVPVIFTGGVGSMTDVGAAWEAGADAVGAGAFCVYSGPNRAVLLTYPSPEKFAEELRRK